MEKIKAIIRSNTLWRVFFLSSFLSCSISFFSQGTVLSGTVTDITEEGLPGVSIMVKGTTVGTITDISGKYSLMVPNERSVLIFSYIGYVTQEIIPGKQTVLNLILTEDTKELSEIVVVGYGTQKKINLSGSVSSVNLEDLNEKRPVSNLQQGLQGKMSGLMIEQTSGQPGDEATNILIRGRGTLNNASPLIIVDGIVGSLSEVAPADVATVSVLKDAASAAIYGSRAANGVILITTKQGNKDKIKVTYNAYMGTQQPTFNIEVIDDYPLYMETLNKARLRANQPIYYEQDIINEWREMSGKDEIYSNTNWFKEVFKSAAIQQHSLQVVGGTEKTNMMISLSYQGDNGNMPETDFEKYTLRVNLGAQVKPFIKVGLNSNIFHSIAQNTNDLVSTYLGYVSNSSPGTLPRASDGRLGSEWAPGGNLQANNITASFESLDRHVWSTSILAKPYITVSITPKITWNTSVGFTYHYAYQKTSEAATPLYNLKTGDIVRMAGAAQPTLYDINRRAQRLVFDSYVNWEVPINLHHINMIAGYNQEYEEESDNSAVGFNMLSVETDVMDATSTGNKPEGGFANRAIRSVFGRFNYDFASRYFFEANLRYDGSSKFAKGNRWGLFPSFSVAWRLSEEPFIKNANTNWLDNFKLRASWGQLGNNRSSDYGTQSFYTSSNAVLGESVVQGMSPGGLTNSDLTWETTTMMNAGIEINILKNKMHAVVDVFNKRTDGILLQLPIPLVLGGLEAPFQNAAQVTNNGVELEIGWNDRIEKVNYALSFNYTFVRNHVNKYRGDVATYRNQQILREDLKIYPFYVREVEQIATHEIINQMLADGYSFYPSTPQPGDFIYKDQQNEGEYGYKVINDDDRVVMGNATPEQMFGFYLSADWNGFDFSALFQGVAGVNRYLNNRWFTNVLNNGSVVNKYFLNAWSEENTNSSIPAITTEDGGRNTANNNFWLQDASYLRLKNIQLGYILPAPITQWIDADRLRVYVSVENLVTFTKFIGMDPEIGGANVYPNLKRFVCGISLSF